jgi:hypothetical protein
MALTRVRLGATGALATLGVFLVVRALVGIEFPALPRLPFMPGGDARGRVVAPDSSSDNVSEAPRAARPAAPVSFAAPDRTLRPERPRPVTRVRPIPLPTVSVVDTTPPPTIVPPVPTPIEPPKVEPPPPPKVEIPQPQPLPDPTIESQPLPTLEVPTLETPTPEPLPTLESPELQPLPGLTAP